VKNIDNLLLYTEKKKQKINFVIYAVNEATNIRILFALVFYSHQEFSVHKLDILIRYIMIRLNTYQIFTEALRTTIWLIAASKGYTLEIERLNFEWRRHIFGDLSGSHTSHFCSIQQSGKAVEMLIDYGSDVNKVTSQGETPLLIAVKTRNAEIAESLIRAGADIDATDRFDATPLHYASVYGIFRLSTCCLLWDFNR